jgi:hypothetical protein
VEWFVGFLFHKVVSKLFESSLTQGSHPIVCLLNLLFESLQGNLSTLEPSINNCLIESVAKALDGRF